MGSKVVSTGAIVYRQTPNTIPESRIVYPDLVRSLRFNPNKYLPPTLDEQDAVTLDSVFLKAAKEAGVSQITVYAPCQSDVSPCATDELICNYVFFETARFDACRLATLFEKYQMDCVKALETPFIRTGEIFLVTHKQLGSDVLNYRVLGRLVSLENKRAFTAPARALHSSLEQAIGRIRSVDGMRLHSNTA